MKNGCLCVCGLINGISCCDVFVFWWGVVLWLVC